MSWRVGSWTRIAAVFMALVALALAAGSGLAQEFDYTLEELEDKIDKSPWGPNSCWPGWTRSGGPIRSGTTSTSWAKLEPHPDR